MIGKKYCLITKWVDAIPLSELSDDALQQIIFNKGLKWFEKTLAKICDLLEENRISHRDFHKKNILISDENVFLIDFSWAIFTDEDNPVVKGKFQNRDDREDAAAIVEDV